jgi:parallel beta-helix repeat protein
MSRLHAALALTIGLAGCTPVDGPAGSTEPRPATMPSAAAAPGAVIVSPGQSIQAAIDAAPPGGRILIRAGTYEEGVTISTPGLTLQGISGPDGSLPLLQNPGGVPHGVNVIAGGDGVIIHGIAVHGFERNGVFLRNVQGFTIRDVVATDNGAYGIYPVLSREGVMRHNRASGHADAGLYIGQSSDVVIEHNDVRGNVIGIEVSNSVRIRARHNHAEDNTIGILAILLPPSPFRQFLEASHLEISHNRVQSNNRPNFAPPGDLASFVPSGSGILVIGFDDSVVEHNHVVDNGWVGIAVGSTATFGALAGIPIVGIEPDPDRGVVRHNRLDANGHSPPPPPFPLPGVDILWDLTGTGNCWARNRFDHAFPSPLPTC